MQISNVVLLFHTVIVEGKKEKKEKDSRRKEKNALIEADCSGKYFPFASSCQ